MPDVFSKRQESYSRPRAQFFSYKDLPRPLINCFLPSEINRLSLEKETGKKSIMLTKYHVVLLKASSCGCKFFFHFNHSGLNPFTLIFE